MTLRTVVVLVLVLVGASPGDSRAWDPMQSARRAAAEGQAAFAEGDTTKAIREFMRAQTLAPEDAEIAMGLGETLYRATDYRSARRQFESIAGDRAAGMQANALYNAGNAAFDEGELEAALDHYTRALLEAGPEPAEDLLHNLELTQRLLEQQQQQQQQQQDGEDSQDQQQDQQQSDQQQQSEDQQQQDQQQQDEQQQQDQQQQEQQPQEQPQPEPQEGGEEEQESPSPEEESRMTPEEAMRLLQALDADEEELRKSIQRRLRGEERETEHDW